jgi:hypothetical protein
MHLFQYFQKLKWRRGTQLFNQHSFLGSSMLANNDYAYFASVVSGRLFVWKLAFPTELAVGSTPVSLLGLTVRRLEVPIWTPKGSGPSLIWDPLTTPFKALLSETWMHDGRVSLPPLFASAGQKRR